MSTKTEKLLDLREKTGATAERRRIGRIVAPELRLLEDIAHGIEDKDCDGFGEEKRRSILAAVEVIRGATRTTKRKRGKP